MKRLFTCITIMAVIIFLAAGSLYITKKSNNQLSQSIDAVTSAYNENGDTKGELKKLDEFWQDYYIKISYIAKTDFLNDISSTIARLEYLLENDSDEFLSELESVRRKATLLYNSQYPYLYSVF